MKNDINNTDLNAITKSAWQHPTIGYIDIKSTMSTPGGSVTDTIYTGSASTTQV
jgi:hypothetical protein